MPYLFREQLYIGDNASLDIGGFLKIQICTKVLSYDASLPVIQSEGGVLIGWAWDCQSGKKIGDKDLVGLSKANYIEKTEAWAGRYLAIIDNRYVFPDSTGSFPIYYSTQAISSNYELLRVISHNTDLADAHKSSFRHRIYLPPLTKNELINRLIPGQFFDLINNQAISVCGFLRTKYSSESLEEQYSSVIELLSLSAKGLRAVVGDDYRLMLTGGKDSRLSLLALMRATELPFNTFTHLKPFFLNDPNDVKVPRQIARQTNINHRFTKRKNDTSVDLVELNRHGSTVAGETEPGSTYFYYKNNNWMQIDERYLIDNYYEIGRMHLHGKGLTKEPADLTLRNIVDSGYSTTEDGYSELMKHLETIAGGVNLLDVFYFVKNYTNVANQFEMISYSHTPLIFCNSLSLLRRLLSVSETNRADGKFHMELLKRLNYEEIMDIPYNEGADEFTFRLKNKIRNLVMKCIY